MGTLRKAILADLVHYALPKKEAEDRMRELEELTRTYGGVAVVKTIQRRAKPDYRTFIGKGKVDEVAAQGKALGADLLLVNEILKPQQLYNLEELLRPAKIQVWDRIDLILHIFDKHAKTAEAKLEIELASIRHMGPRIFNMSAELGRQRGGTGTRGGTGETNTEAMKRHLREREQHILQKLERYQGTRNLHQEHRRRHHKKTVALVGYTNAGKTSLLNTLGKRREFAANKLFATLDTRVADVYIPELGETVLLSDTIGFIQGLPPSLIRAFRSTLSEAATADLLLHVIDVSDPKFGEKIAVVEGVLDAMGIADHPRMYVFNKIDAVRDPERLRRELGDCGVIVSAERAVGVAELKSAIARTFSTTARVSP
ncbi:GTPase HflX [Candidatus Uhrbacteria bacterium]|nr:GTPase HflX [Candidatus Uhrbacteria bacterium]